MSKRIMKLKDLLLSSTIFGPDEQELRAVQYDSREIEAGDAFVCISGEHQDGHVYIEEAITSGAKVIVGTDVDKLQDSSARYPNVSFVQVEDAREALASLSESVYGYPSQELSTIGVTGTNGKTTVSNFIYHLLNAMSYKAGLLGTAGIWDNEGKTDFKQTVPTTPEAPDIQRALAYFRQKGMGGAVIETTSIALEQKRVATIDFDVAVHTNLTPEHLEFHGTMDAYKEAKLKLFRQAGKAVVNIDDPVMSGDILQIAEGPVLTYAIEKEADLQAVDVKTCMEGTSFTVIANDQTFRVRAPIYGRYNVSNLLAAIGACHQLGFSLEEIITVVAEIETPEGRFQLVKNKDISYQILLDYAHTPDALTNVLQAVQDIPYRRLILMITGIGLRDPKKRPLMAKIAEGKADEIIVSVDQPGHVDRQEIINDVKKGFVNPDSPHIHSRLHREDAIHLALSMAGPGDLVLLTGIGFGGYQIIGDEKVPYSELEVIEQFFEENLVESGEESKVETSI